MTDWIDWADFVHMGGYGLYVWGSMGMCAAALLAEVVLLRLRRRALLAPAGPVHDAAAHEGTP